MAAWDSGFRAGVVTGTHREGGAWHPVELTGGPARGGFPAGTSFLGDLAADGQGDALTAWRDDNGVQTAAFDAAGPRFTAFSLPVGGSAGGALPFTAAADDNWSGPPTISWTLRRRRDGARARRSPTPTRPAAATSRPRAPPTARATSWQRQRHRAVRIGRRGPGRSPTVRHRRQRQGRHQGRLRHQQRRPAAEGVQDRQRDRRLRRGVREAARRLQRRARRRPARRPRASSACWAPRRSRSAPRSTPRTGA